MQGDEYLIYVLQVLDNLADEKKLEEILLTSPQKSNIKNKQNWLVHVSTPTNATKCHQFVANESRTNYLYDGIMRINKELLSYIHSYIMLPIILLSSASCSLFEQVSYAVQFPRTQGDTISLIIYILITQCIRMSDKCARVYCSIDQVQLQFIGLPLFGQTM